MSIFRLILPQSFRARLAWLVLATVLAGQAATLYLVSRYQRDHAQTVALDLLATTLRTLQYSMEHVPASERAEFVKQASQGHWRLWSKPLPNEVRLQRRLNRDTQPPPRIEARKEDHRQRLPPSDSITSTSEPPAPLSRPFLDSAKANLADQFSTDSGRRGLVRLVGRLNNRLSGDSRVALSRGSAPEIYISLTRLNDGDTLTQREWLVIPIHRIDPPVANSLIAWWLAGLALVLVVAGWFSWHITRPITRLVDATDRLAAGKPAQVEPAGPAEIKRLGERFNAMLEALSQSESTRRTLLAGLPHDLKAPLSRMWLRIEMTDDLALKDGMRQDLQDMQHMVDQFIQYVRGSDPTTYRFTHFALNDWIAERVATWHGAGSDITLVGPLPAAQVNADNVALARLVDNLVSNALHHGAAPIHLSLKTEAHWVILTVSDHGVGIAPELRAQALKPFVRLDEARTRTGNVGLGLALAEAIAIAHGGTLTLGQAEQGGLQVELRLPLAES